MKRLPVGDAIWIAHHKVLHTEYVLDFIVERKSVDDLVGSIRDNRYKDQKLRLKVPSELALTSVISI
jgi:crossover junction endonuclease MUS81